MKTRTGKNYFVIAIALLALIALVGSAQALPNLTVTKAIDPGYVFSNLTNVWSAQVTNTGDTDANNFDVNITITSDATLGTLYAHTTIGVSVAGNDTTEIVSLGTWKPDKVENITINVTADYSNTITESNETDNSRIETRNTTGAGCYDTSAYINRMLEKECFGYRGQHPLTEKLVGGSDIIYTVGDYKYLSAYIGGGVYERHNYSVNFTLGASPLGDVNRVDSTYADIPAGATIKNARLYLYYNSWRRDTLGLITDNSNMTFVAGACNPDLANEVAADDLYTDFKNYSTTTYGKDREYGTIAYNVTAVVTGNGSYCGYFINNESGSPRLAFSGMALLVVYDDGSSKVYRIAEGLDRLATKYRVSANKKYSYHVVPEDATTSATLTDANPCGDVTDANLFTVTVDGVDSGTGDPTGESQKVNDCPWYEGAWDNDGLGSGGDYPLGFNRTEVTDCLSAAAAAETVQYRETDTSANMNGYSAVLAVLVVEKEPIESYGDSIFFKKNVLFAQRALGEPDNRGALMRRNAKIAIELDETIPDCKKVSVWVRRVAWRAPSFKVGVSSNGVDWTEIGSETCTSWWWTRYDFTGDWCDVNYIGISKPGTPCKPKLMGLDAVYAEGWS